MEQLDKMEFQRLASGHASEYPNPRDSSLEGQDVKHTCVERGELNEKTKRQTVNSVKRMWIEQVPNGKRLSFKKRHGL